ncbi:MAG TPA: alpha/beta hydrolase [Magnetospirillaceae bacterium]|jgi:pimeloyl-ACP methyl ester carboxylesterase
MTSIDIAIAQSSNAGHATKPRRATRGSFVETEDGTQLFYRDWGTGSPIVFCHPWGLNADIWEYQLTALSNQGLRCIAFDRRGHGRSDDPGHGYDFATLAADLASLIEQLDLHDVTLVGYSMGSGEAIHYLSRYGTERVARLLVTSPISPVSSDSAMIDGFIAALEQDRPACIAAGLPLFTGYNDLVSPAMARWVENMFLSASPKAGVAFQRAVVLDDHMERLKDIAVPTLILQGDADEVAPLDQTGRMLAAAIPDCELRIYEGAPHGIALTHRQRFTQDLLNFVRGE